MVSVFVPWLNEKPSELQTHEHEKKKWKRRREISSFNVRSTEKWRGGCLYGEERKRAINNENRNCKCKRGSVRGKRSCWHQKRKS